MFCGDKMKNATRLAVCSVITALSVLILFLGGLSFVLAYAAPMFVGFILIMLKTTFGAASAWLTYISISLLSFILVPDKECMLMYVMFFGFYPIIQPDINKIKSPFLRIPVKFLIFNIMTALCQLALVYIFGIPFLEDGTGKTFILVYFVMMNVVFFLNDRLLNVLSFLYKRKFEKRIKRIFK